MVIQFHSLHCTALFTKGQIDNGRFKEAWRSGCLHDESTFPVSAGLKSAVDTVGVFRPTANCLNRDIISGGVRKTFESKQCLPKTFVNTQVHDAVDRAEKATNLNAGTCNKSKSKHK